MKVKGDKGSIPVPADGDYASKKAQRSSSHSPAGLPKVGGHPQLGTNAYGGETVKARPITPAVLAAEVQDLCAVAIAYAEAGRPQLARRRLGEAEDALVELRAMGSRSAEPGRHPGLLNKGEDPRAIAEASFHEANTAVAAAHATAPVGEGQPWKRLVVLFGSSMNPPTGTGGHMGIVDWAGRTLRPDVPNDEDPSKAREDVPVDEVWVLPVYKHIYSSKSNMVDFDHRMAMAKLAFEAMPGLEGRVQVMDTERQVVQKAFADAEKKGIPPEQVRVGTIDVIRHLIADNPDTQFVLALGGDTFKDLEDGKWKEGDELQRLVPVVVVPRKGVGVAGTEEVGPDLSDISSTKVRGSTDISFLSEALHRAVLDYIIKHKLFAFSEDQGA